MIYHVLDRFEYHLREAARKASDLLRSRYGLSFLGMVSFVESALPVPLITDPFLVAYLLAVRSRVVAAVVVTTAASLLGGLLAYLGAVYFTEVTLTFLTPSMAADFYAVTDRFRDDTLWLAIVGAITPLPYTIVAMAAGAIKGDLLFFLLGSLLGRGFRYALLAALTVRYGDRALRLAERHLFLATGVVAVLLGAYLAYKLL